VATGTVSRCSSRVGPSYQIHPPRSLSTTLSPSGALIGTHCTCGMPSCPANTAENLLRSTFRTTSSSVIDEVHLVHRRQNNCVFLGFGLSLLARLGEHFWPSSSPPTCSRSRDAPSSWVQGLPARTVARPPTSRLLPRVDLNPTWLGVDLKMFAYQPFADRPSGSSSSALRVAPWERHARAHRLG